MSEQDNEPKRREADELAAQAIASTQTSADILAMQHSVLGLSSATDSFTRELRASLVNDTAAQQFSSSLASDRLAQEFATIGRARTYVEEAALAPKPYLDSIAAFHKTLDTSMVQAAAALVGFADRMNPSALTASRLIQEQVNRWKDFAKPSALALEALGIGAWAESFSQSPAMASIQRISKEMETIGSFRAMKDSASASQAVASILSVSKATEEFERAVGRDFMSALQMPSKNLDTIKAQLAALAESPLFRVLESSEPHALEALITSSEANLRSYSSVEEWAQNDQAPSNSSSATPQAEIIDALQGTGKRKALSPAALFLLLWFTTHVLGAYAPLSQWNDFREGICDFNDRIPDMISTAGAKKLVRDFLCHMPASASARLRLVTRDGVNLREEPRMKSGIIMKIDKYAVLEVTDSSDRTWLQVIYKHDGAEIEGWVSRSMVRTVSK